MRAVVLGMMLRYIQVSTADSGQGPFSRHCVVEGYLSLFYIYFYSLRLVAFLFGREG